MVFGYKVTCYTDQERVLSILSQNHLSKYARYRARAAIYCPKVCFVSGRKSKADWFSRYPWKVEESVHLFAVVEGEIPGSSPVEKLY